MQLLKFFLVFSLCSATAEEVCVGETFRAACSAGEVVFIESANYGRMRNNRCFNLTQNESRCSADVRQQLQSKYGVHQSFEFKLLAEDFSSMKPTCLLGNMPFLEISYQCIKRISNEVCIQETFNATCPSGRIIHIQSALYGRMRSSPCIEFDNRDLNCYTNVQPYLESLCSERIECSIKASDDNLRHPYGDRCRSGKPYLEVFYACVYEFSCPPFTLPKGTKKQRLEDGYHVMCDNKSLPHKVLCRDGKWTIDPEQLCRTKDLAQLLLFSSVAGVFMLTAIIAVVVCLKRIQNKKKTNVTRSQAEVGDDYVDYPVSHLRRQGGTCGSEDEYEYEYEYDVQQEDGTYGCYSHVRDTGP